MNKFKSDYKNIYSIFMFSYLCIIHSTCNINAGPVYNRINKSALIQHDITNNVYNELHAQCDITSKNHDLLLYAKKHIEEQKAMIIEETSWEQFIGKNKVPKKKWVFAPYKKTKEGQFLFLQNLPDHIKIHIGDYAGLNVNYKDRYTSHLSLIDTFYAIIYCDDNTYKSKLLQNMLDLIDCGANIHMNNERSETILASCAYHYKEIDLEDSNKKYIAFLFQCLLNKGACIDTTIKRELPSMKDFHEPLLHYIAHPGTIRFLEMVITKKPNLDVKNRTGQNPLDVARERAMTHTYHPSNRKQYYKICAVLENAGAHSPLELELMPSDETLQDQYLQAFHDCSDYQPDDIGLECREYKGLKHFLNKNNIPKDIVHIIALNCAQDSLLYVIEKKINLNVPLKTSSFYFSADLGSSSSSSSFDKYTHNIFGQNYIDQITLLQASHTPLDIARFYAMSHIIRPEDRMRYYQMCEILEQAGAKSSIELKLMEPLQIMQQEYDQVPHLSWNVYECPTMIPRQRKYCCTIS